jgi:hypothetical protein
VQLCPAAWRRRSATLLSTPPLSSTATRSGALPAAAHRTRCSSVIPTTPGAPDGETASGAEDESVRKDRGRRRGRGRGLGPGRRAPRRSGRRVETTRSMGGSLVPRAVGGGGSGSVLLLPVLDWVFRPERLKFQVSCHFTVSEFRLEFTKGGQHRHPPLP